MNTMKEIVLALIHSVQTTFMRADSCYKFVLCTLVALVIVSAIIGDCVYASYGVVLSVLVYNAEYWKQKADFYRQQLGEDEDDAH